jgi:glycerol-3-phosphate dehydrogenase
LEHSSNVRFATSPFGRPLRDSLRRGFAYSDCTVDDSRLVILNAKDAAAVTRDYVLDVDAPPRGAPVLSVFGGKITTYRRLAEHALKKLERHLGPMGKSWTGTGTTPLPGGDYWRHMKAGLYASPADERRLAAYLRSIGHDTGYARAALVG